MRVHIEKPQPKVKKRRGFFWLFNRFFDRGTNYYEKGYAISCTVEAVICLFSSLLPLEQGGYLRNYLKPSLPNEDQGL